MKGNLKIILCTVISSMLALAAHIYISSWTRPYAAKMMQGIHTDPNNYPIFIYFASFGTAIITVGLLVFLYYHAGYPLSIKNRFIKAIVLAGIILELKGDSPTFDGLYLQPITWSKKNP